MVIRGIKRSEYWPFPHPHLFPANSSLLVAKQTYHVRSITSFPMEGAWWFRPTVELIVVGIRLLFWI